VLAGHGQPGDEGLAHAIEINQRHKNEAACNSGNAHACFLLGSLCDHPQTVAPDYSLAGRAYQQACDGGDASGCDSLALLYRLGKGVPIDTQKAVTLQERACEGGVLVTCDLLARDLEFETTGTPASNAEEACKLYKRACDGGDMVGCHGLDRLYDRCQGGSGEFAHGLAAIQKECDAGKASGCENLAWFYEKGRGVAHDSARAEALNGKAHEVHEKECEAVPGSGCTTLGQFEERTQDYAGARQAYGKACDAGEKMACLYFSVLLDTGKGGKRDQGSARALKAKGCEGLDKSNCDGLIQDHQRLLGEQILK
jgi:hypothetical protein